METFGRGCYVPLPTQFKSYYVVWKPRKVVARKAAVHSLNRTMQYGNCSIPNKDNCALSSLNRTMQYGNSTGELCSIPNKEFKSYYVVWKLPMKTKKNKYKEV